MQDFLTGFFVSIGLIVAIGAQNAWVLGMSIRRCYPWMIAFICLFIDATLMAVGVIAFQSLQQWLPAILPWFTWVGILMLLWLALQAAIRVIRGTSGLQADRNSKEMTALQVVLSILAISLLNPHVYLDTVVLIGSIAAVRAMPWVFWSGAALASAAWFLSLAAIGKPLSRWLKSPRRWRFFDSGLMVIMAWMAFGLWQTLL
jgi:L-lysine exporter family protein LysE/ArgO